MSARNSIISRSANAFRGLLWVDVVEKVGHERVEALYWAFAVLF